MPVFQLSGCNLPLLQWESFRDSQRKTLKIIIIKKKNPRWKPLNENTRSWFRNCKGKDDDTQPDPWEKCLLGHHCTQATEWSSKCSLMGANRFHTDSPKIKNSGFPLLVLREAARPSYLSLPPALFHSLPGLLPLFEEGKPLGKSISNKSQSVFIKYNSNKGKKRGCPQQLAALPPTVTSAGLSSTHPPDGAKQARKMRRQGRGGRRTSETIIAYESEIWTTVSSFFFPSW